MFNKRQITALRTCAIVATALLLFPVGSALALSSVAVAGTATLEKIRVANHEKYQRVVIDSNDAVTFKIVENEEALILELSGITSQTQTQQWSDLGNVKGLRIEPVSDTSIRIIFDLAAPMLPRISSYTPDSYGGHRVVIDLWPSVVTVAEQAQMEETGMASEPAEEPMTELAHATPDPVSNTAAGFTPVSARPSNHAPAVSKQTPGPGPKPVPESGLKKVDQWPETMSDTADTIIQKQAEDLIHGQPTLGEEMHGASDDGGIMNEMATTDPVSTARERMAEGSPSEACKVLQTNYPKGTWNIDAMLLQGECLRAIGNLADANILYTEVLSYEPESSAARLGLAHIQVENGDLTAARDNYTRALAKLPPGDLANDTRLRLQEVEKMIEHAVH